MVLDVGNNINKTEKYNIEQTKLGPPSTNMPPCI